MALDHRVEQAPYRLLVGHVGRDRVEVGMSRGHLVERPAAAPGDDDGPAVLGQGESGGGADAASAAGDRPMRAAGWSRGRSPRHRTRTTRDACIPMP